MTQISQSDYATSGLLDQSICAGSIYFVHASASDTPALIVPPIQSPGNPNSVSVDANVGQSDINEIWLKKSLVYLDLHNRNIFMFYHQTYKHTLDEERINQDVSSIEYYIVELSLYTALPLPLTNRMMSDGSNTFMN